VGKVLLGYPEKEVWHMTVRKLMLLFTEWQKQNGQYKEPETIDSF